MHIRHIAAAVTAASLMAGCAIHPEPEDVTGVDTADIVKQIRCETRDAGRRIILRELERLATFGSNATAQDLLTQYSANQDLMSGFNPNVSFPGRDNVQLRNLFNLIYSTGLAYSFTLTMNEQNDLGTSWNFLGPWVPTKLTLGIGANANRSRENERTFTITDTLGYLLGPLNTQRPGKRQYCDGHVAMGPNYIYPIAGQIGVYKTVYTFLQMAIFDGLAPKPGGSGTTPAMADKLTFITTVDLSATPKLVFTQVGTNFQATDGSLTGLARRKDTHQVTVGVALDPGANAPLLSLRGFVFSGAGITDTRVASGRRGGGGQLLVLNRVTASAVTRAEQLAVQIVDQVNSKEVTLVPASR